MTKIDAKAKYLLGPHASGIEATEEARLREDAGPTRRATSQTRVSRLPRREEPLTDG